MDHFGPTPLHTLYMHYILTAVINGGNEDGSDVTFSCSVNSTHDLQLLAMAIWEGGGGVGGCVQGRWFNLQCIGQNMEVVCGQKLLLCNIHQLQLDKRGEGEREKEEGRGEGMRGERGREVRGERGWRREW